MAEDALNSWMMELDMNMGRLQGIVEEVGQAISDGKLDVAAMVLGSQTGKVHRFTEAYGELQKALREAGADPQRALRPD
jgi:hypothetical protein